MANTTFFFYDLETSGFDPRTHRIMQFAGQRTDMDLNPIGEPVNLLVKLTPEILPSPEAILITGITPQQTVREGITEAELMQVLTSDVFTPDTIATGFNSVRFDDIFIRFLHYRNFYDPYEWAWADGRSRWDLLDVMRMARALRPDGFEWPVDEAGRPVNKLAMLSAANGLVHTRAHDALSDVEALIAVGVHLRKCQPKLFEYLLTMRSKHEVAKVVSVENPQPFVYTSGRYGADHHFTTVAYPIGSGRNKAVIVYDLRQDPAMYASLTVEQLAASRFPSREDRAQPDFKPFPAKELSPGNCPAVSPLAALDAASQERIHLDKATIARHLAALEAGDLIDRLKQVMRQEPSFPPLTDVDGRLYEGFLGNADKAEQTKIRTASPAALAALTPRFTDPRLPGLFSRYKARNFPDIMTDADREDWEAYRFERLQNDWPAFAEAMDRCGQTADAPSLAILTDLKLWAENLAPTD